MLSQDSTFYRFYPAVVTLLSWGLMCIPSTFAVAEIPTAPLMAVRMTIATAVLAICAWKIEGRIMPDRHDILTAVLMGAIGMYGNNTLYLLAITRTSLVNVAICFATTPLLTAVLAAIFLGEKLRSRHIAGILMALFGVLLLLCDGDLSILINMKIRSGDAIELLGALCSALMMIMGRKIRTSPPFSVTFCCMLTSCVLCWISWCFSGGDFSGATWKGYMALLYLSLLSSGAAYLCQQLSLERIGARATGAFLNAETALSVFAASFFMGEHISMVQIGSAVIIFLGLFTNVSASDGIVKKAD